MDGVCQWEQFDVDPNKNPDLADLNVFNLVFDEADWIPSGMLRH